MWGRPNVDADYKGASQWFVKAKSSPAAQFSLGYMYLHGLYFNMDLNKALEYFIKALQGGYTFAQFGVDWVDKINFMKSMQVKVSRRDYESTVKIMLDSINAAADEKAEGEEQEY